MSLSLGCCSFDISQIYISISHILALTLSEVGNDCPFLLAKLPGDW